MLRTYITEINGKYYAFAGDTAKDQVYSIGADQPSKDSGFFRRVSVWSLHGVLYVASPSPNRNAAIAKAKRHGDYFGEV